MNNVDFVAKTEELLTPVRTLNALAIANIEKMVDLQLTSARKYANMALESAKAAAAVKDIEGVKAFSASQVEILRQSADNWVADSKVIAELSKEFGTKAQAVVKESMEKAAKIAA